MTDEKDERNERLNAAAAALSSAVGSLLEQMVDDGDLPKQDVAERMGVSPSRISQLLTGDGNLRMATLARFAEACGYDLTLTATPRDTSTKRPITVPRTSRPRRNGGTRTPSLRVIQTPEDFYEGQAHRKAAL